MNVNTKDRITDASAIALLALAVGTIVGAVILGLLAGHPEPLIGLGVALVLFGTVWGTCALIERR